MARKPLEGWYEGGAWLEPGSIPAKVCLSLQYLLHYLISLKNWLNRYSWQRTPISVTAWALLRDSYHGGLCLRFAAQHLAVAVLYLALHIYGVEVPAEAEAEKPWWQVRWLLVVPVLGPLS